MSKLGHLAKNGDDRNREPLLQLFVVCVAFCGSILVRRAESRKRVNADMRALVLFGQLP
jgi:hypothetical protein